MSEKQKRTTLSLEVKKFIIITKEKNPQMSYRQLAEELLLKFDIKTSRSVICRTIKSKVEIMSLKMENDAAKKRKQMYNKGRMEFRKLLDSKLRKKFLKRMVKKLEIYLNEIDSLTSIFLT